MYRKKFVYSFFTFPVAVVTFRFYDWHRERMLEKLRETERRKEKLNEAAVNIQNFYNPETQKFDWSGLNSYDLTKQWGLKPIELVGEYDHTKEVKVKRVRNGEDGFDIITPFYCYNDKEGERLPVLVHRGWIPYDWEHERKHHVDAFGRQLIKGVVYRPEGNKYSQPNYVKEEEWNTINPNEISIARLLPNRKTTSDFLIKQIEYNPINKTIFPVVFNVGELGQYPVAPKENGNCAAVFKGLTFLNLFSNMLVWIYF